MNSNNNPDFQKIRKKMLNEYYKKGKIVLSGDFNQSQFDFNLNNSKSSTYNTTNNDKILALKSYLVNKQHEDKINPTNYKNNYHDSYNNEMLDNIDIKYKSVTKTSNNDNLSFRIIPNNKTEVREDLVEKGVKYLLLSNNNANSNNTNNYTPGSNNSRIRSISVNQEPSNCQKALNYNSPSTKLNEKVNYNYINLDNQLTPSQAVCKKDTIYTLLNEESSQYIASKYYETINKDSSKGGIVELNQYLKLLNEIERNKNKKCSTNKKVIKTSDYYDNNQNINIYELNNTFNDEDNKKIEKVNSIFSINEINNYNSNTTLNIDNTQNNVLPNPSIAEDDVIEKIDKNNNNNNKNSPENINNNKIFFPSTSKEFNENEITFDDIKKNNISGLSTKQLVSLPSKEVELQFFEIANKNNEFNIKNRSISNNVNDDYYLVKECVYNQRRLKLRELGQIVCLKLFQSNYFEVDLFHQNVKSCTVKLPEVADEINSSHNDKNYSKDKDFNDSEINSKLEFKPDIYNDINKNNNGIYNSNNETNNEVEIIEVIRPENNVKNYLIKNKSSNNYTNNRENNNNPNKEEKNKKNKANLEPNSTNEKVLINPNNIKNNLYEKLNQVTSQINNNINEGNNSNTNHDNNTNNNNDNNTNSNNNGLISKLNKIKALKNTINNLDFNKLILNKSILNNSINEDSENNNNTNNKETVERNPFNYEIWKDNVKKQLLNSNTDITNNNIIDNNTNTRNNLLKNSLIGNTNTNNTKNNNLIINISNTEKEGTGVIINNNNDYNNNNINDFKLDSKYNINNFTYELSFRELKVLKSQAKNEDFDCSKSKLSDKVPIKVLSKQSSRFNIKGSNVKLNSDLNSNISNTDNKSKKHLFNAEDDDEFFTKSNKFYDMFSDKESNFINKVNNLNFNWNTKILGSNSYNITKRVGSSSRKNPSQVRVKMKPKLDNSKCNSNNFRKNNSMSNSNKDFKAISPGAYDLKRELTKRKEEDRLEELFGNYNTVIKPKLNNKSSSSTNNIKLNLNNQNNNYFYEEYNQYDEFINSRNNDLNRKAYLKNLKKEMNSLANNINNNFKENSFYPEKSITNDCVSSTSRSKSNNKIRYQNFSNNLQIPSPQSNILRLDLGINNSSFNVDAYIKKAVNEAKTKNTLLEVDFIDELNKLSSTNSYNPPTNNSVKAENIINSYFKKNNSLLYYCNHPVEFNDEQINKINNLSSLHKEHLIQRSNLEKQAKKVKNQIIEEHYLPRQINSNYNEFSNIEVFQKVNLPIKSIAFKNTSKDMDRVLQRLRNNKNN